MQPEDVQKAADSALKWVDEQMTPADLVAVASIGIEPSGPHATSRAQGAGACGAAAFSATDGTAFAAVDASTAATDEAAQTRDRRLDGGRRARRSSTRSTTTCGCARCKTLAEALQPIQQKKAIIYFSSGMQRSGTDNQVELRAAVNAARARQRRRSTRSTPAGCRRSCRAAARGRRSRGGLGAFTGSAVASQFTQLAAQQETLTTLASDTGGTAFTDTNDFGEAFTKVDDGHLVVLHPRLRQHEHRDRDGRFRRITVRVKNRSGLKVEATRRLLRRPRLRAHGEEAIARRCCRNSWRRRFRRPTCRCSSRPDGSGWRRTGTTCRSRVAVPGLGRAAVERTRVTLDVAGFIRDERGFPVGRIRDTLTRAARERGRLAARQVLYQTGVTLPPGRFSVKIVVRENASGQMGTFETPIVVPELKQAPVKVSSVVLSTQLQSAARPKDASPLVRDGVELVPNLTHIVGRIRSCTSTTRCTTRRSTTARRSCARAWRSIAASVKVFETPVVERTQIDVADRHAAIFQFEVPAGSLKPGLYTCQVNIIDAVAGRFTFPRLQMYVR